MLLVIYPLPFGSEWVFCRDAMYRVRCNKRRGNGGRDTSRPYNEWGLLLPYRTDGEAHTAVPTVRDNLAEIEFKAKSPGAFILRVDFLGG